MSSEILKTTTLDEEKQQDGQRVLKVDHQAVEKVYNEPLQQRTKHIFDQIFAYELASNQTPEQAQKTIEKIARYCKNTNISQERIKTLTGNEYSPVNNNLNWSYLKSYLEGKPLPREKSTTAELEATKKQEAELDQQNAAGMERVAEKKEQNAAGAERLQGKREQDIAQKKEIGELKQDKVENIEKQATLEKRIAAIKDVTLPAGAKLDPLSDQDKQRLKNVGGIDENTYQKLKYLTQSTDENVIITNERGHRVSLETYRTDFQKEYGATLKDTFDNINERMTVSSNVEDAGNNAESGIQKETGKKWNDNGFNNTLSKLRGEFRSEKSVFNDVLEAKVNDVLDKNRLKQDKGELGDIGLPWRDELKSDTREYKKNKGEHSHEQDATREIRKNNEVIRNLSRDKIYAVIEGVVDSEEDRTKYTNLLAQYIKDTYQTPTGKEHPTIQPRAERMLDGLFRKSFLVYTRMIMKNQIAEQYLGKVSDMLEVGGQKMVLKEGKDAITYDKDGGMRIKYHTAEAPGLQGEVIVDANGKVSITDMMGVDGQNQKNELKKTPRVLPGRLIPVNEMVNKLKDNKTEFATQWHDSVLASDPNVYKDGDYTRALRSKVKTILSYDDNELHSEEIMRAGMKHTLESARSFDSLARMQNTFQTNPPKIDTFMKYYTGQINSIPNLPEYSSLFVIRDMCKNESADTIKRFDEATQRLIRAYQSIPRETNPFIQEYVNEHMWKLLGYFVTTQKGTPSFSVEHFEKFTTEVAKTTPVSIERWLENNFEAYLPVGTPKFRECEEKNRETEAESFLDSQLDQIPAAPGGGSWLSPMQQIQPAVA